MPESRFEQFAAKDSNKSLLEQERLILAASELISQLMEEQGVNKATLAQRIGKSRAFVTQALSGSRNLTLRTFAELAGALDHRIEVRGRSNKAESAPTQQLGKVMAFPSRPPDSPRLVARDPAAVKGDTKGDTGTEPE